MFRNQYDTDVTVWESQCRFQVREVVVAVSESVVVVITFDPV
jgi:hypothetical protein